MKTYFINIFGLVQGVGFRPFIYRLAKENNLKGNISNNNHGVEIVINATEYIKDKFIDRIISEKPKASYIASIEIKENKDFLLFDSLNIVSSKSIDNEITGISPDIALCKDCLDDMKNDPTRIDYPFINCTNCGPRFSIIHQIPYDRVSTSMKVFLMCHKCNCEYKNIENRRFHAQPIACNNCGPNLQIAYITDGEIIVDNNITNSDAIEKGADWINKGNILSLKGLGGYNLVCDAFNNSAVEKLRFIKERTHKPFAVMFDKMETAEKYADISKFEKEALSSVRAPIVLLDLKENSSLTLNYPLKTVGAILPYLPLHHLLFEKLNTNAIVFTSGNIKDVPIIIDNNTAKSVLLPKTGFQLDNNREIVNRVDDSIVIFINNKERIIRRSRGYVPQSLDINVNTEGILALGGELNNTFSIGKDTQVIQSQYIGDLKKMETYLFFKETIERFFRLFRFYPKLIACDMHPDYFSTQYGSQLSKELNIPLISVQHHFAHAAAVMAEYKINKPTLSVIFDGTGYGIDGKIWGSEFMIVSSSSFERISHFDYIPLPGGDKATKEPWRCAVSILKTLNIQIPDFLYDNISSEKINIISSMIDSNINSPQSCGAGRIFDAVSALLGICLKEDYNSQAAIELEHCCSKNVICTYPIDFENPLNLHPVFLSLIDDINKGVSKNIIAAIFHNTLVDIIFYEIKRILTSHNLSSKVILCGGCFQNKYLLSRLENKLINEGISPIAASSFPINDESVSIGQLFVASNIRIQNA
ncbi:MAG: carbamoyltransferase HypF [Bacteroidales bacterium]|nr:carbamoyltransferase HypF [Bacteroidales bacterium]